MRVSYQKLSGLVVGLASCLASGGVDFQEADQPLPDAGSPKPPTDDDKVSIDTDPDRGKTRGLGEAIRIPGPSVDSFVAYPSTAQGTVAALATYPPWNANLPPTEPLRYLFLAYENPSTIYRLSFNPDGTPEMVDGEPNWNPLLVAAEMQPVNLMNWGTTLLVGQTNGLLALNHETGEIQEQVTLNGLPPLEDLDGNLVYFDRSRLSGADAAPLNGNICITTTGRDVSGTEHPYLLFVFCTVPGIDFQCYPSENYVAVKADGIGTLALASNMGGNCLGVTTNDGTARGAGEQSVLNLLVSSPESSTRFRMLSASLAVFSGEMSVPIVADAIPHVEVPRSRHLVIPFHQSDDGFLPRGILRWPYDEAMDAWRDTPEETLTRVRGDYNPLSPGFNPEGRIINSALVFSNDAVSMTVLAGDDENGVLYFVPNEPLDLWPLGDLPEVWTTMSTSASSMLVSDGFGRAYDITSYGERAFVATDDEIKVASLSEILPE
ncbi:MAG: hypothetical protein HYT76_00115 [Deltaproteobacteria bacterium]|nr:hypothetical protein [Deltaproteobacteria bacterium]